MPNFFNYSFENPWFFTNYSFLFILGLFLLLYAFLLDKSVLKKAYVILFSLFFYYKSSGPYLIFFIIMIIADYNFAHWIEKVINKRIRKLLLTLSILCSLSFLIYFKYAGFFIQTINDLFESSFYLSDLFLPIGISFYTFQSISYIIDVYDRKIPSSKNFTDYAFYMTFFPHLVAGPIVRARDFIPQINNPLVVDRNLLYESLFRIMTGFGKKLLLADFLAKYVDMLYSSPSSYSGAENLLGMYAYSCQIYFDFSGYSDIAIGIALLMGYRLKENFENPYRSVSITQFWRKWHISLSTWLRDYIYIPLGGNRKGVLNTYLFLMITMTIGGFWHGANWKFVLWGVLHGLALAVHKWFAGKSEKSTKGSNSLVRSIYVLITFHFVSLLWIFFRASHSSVAWDSIEQIFTNQHWADYYGFYLGRTTLVYLLLGSLIIIFSPRRVKELVRAAFIKIPVWSLPILLIIFFQIIQQFRNTEIQPFIYFQF